MILASASHILSGVTHTHIHAHTQWRPMQYLSSLVFFCAVITNFASTSMQLQIHRHSNTITLPLLQKNVFNCN